VERDIRDEDEYLYENRGAGIGAGTDAGYLAALEEADRRHEARRGLGGQEVLVKTATAVCPVCGEFEGDEMAVAHHVEQHFAE
jgi:hypothetical protein